MTNNLPKNWALTKLEEIALINPRSDIGTIPPNTESTFLPMKSVEALTGHIDTSIVKHIFEVRKGYVPFSENDLLLAKITPCMENGKIAIAKGLKNGIGFGSTEFHVIRVNSTILNQFVYFFLFREEFRKNARHNMTGTAGQLRVPASYLANIHIPLPPLPEQKRIVTKIEELFTDLDAGVEALKKSKALIKKYRQSVLKAAFKGKLTESWRNKNKDKLESANNLLEKIKSTRTKNSDGKAKEYQIIDVPNLPDLPNFWEWMPIAYVGSGERNDIVDGPFGSNLKVSDYIKDGNIPVVSITNIDEGFSSEKLRFISQHKFEEIKRSAIKPGDILVAKIGSSYGKCGFYPITMPVGIIPANLLKITVSPHYEDKFVFYFLKSLLFKKNLDLIMKSTAQPAFNVSQFKLLPIPCVSRMEQKVIIEEIEDRFSIADAAEKIVYDGLKQAERLRQSILKKAFEGRLVPQDPNDEPAQKLLDRIKAQKAKTKESKTRIFKKKVSK